MLQSLERFQQYSVAMPVSLSWNQEGRLFRTVHGVQLEGSPLTGSRSPSRTACLAYAMSERENKPESMPCCFHM